MGEHDRGPAIRRKGRLRALAVLGVVALLLAGSVGIFLFRQTRTPGDVRRRLYADLRANRLDRCAEGLEWLERHGRLISEDWMVRARVDHLNGRHQEALACLERIDDRDPLSAQARLMSGTIWLGLDRARPAEAALRKAVERDPGQTSARLELIQLYARQQRLTELDAQFAALADRDLLDFAYLRFWFMTRNAPWDVKGDLPVLRRMADADPEDRWSRLALAEGLRRLGQADEAEEILEEVPESAPDPLAVRARVALDRGDLERAERLLGRDCEGCPSVDRLRGQLDLRRDDARSALRWFRRAYEAAPDDRAVVAGLATAMKLLGMTSEVGPVEDRLRQLDAIPSLNDRISAAGAAEDTDLHRRLGAIDEALGRRSEARAWYRLVIVRDPLDAEAQRAVFRLKKPNPRG